MDTGAYMANQIDDQITASEYKYQAFCDRLEKDVNEFIEEIGGGWTFDEVLVEYKKYLKDDTVGFEARKIIYRFEERLKLCL